MIPHALTTALIIAASALPAAAATLWRPITAGEFQWELDHEIDIHSASDMGTGQTAYTGARVPVTNPVVYDIDGFDNSSTVVFNLHAINSAFRVVCYISVGTAENWRPDYKDFPKVAIGRPDSGWQGEYYLDVRNAEVVSIMKARILNQCHDKGFDGIETDNDEAWQNDTGFPLTQADFVTYERTLAAYAHSLNVAVIGKNMDDAWDGDPGDLSTSYAVVMEPYVDAQLSEQCDEYDTCGALAIYTQKGKPVWEVEYDLQTSRFCSFANKQGVGWMGTYFGLDLTGLPRTPCR